MNNLVNFTKTLASSAWMQCFAMNGEFRSLKDQTAIVYPDALSHDVCRELISRIDVICNIEEHPRVWRDDVKSDTRILGFERDIPDLIGRFEIERRIQAVNAYLGLRIKSWSLMANRLLPREGNLGSGGGLHRDSPFSHQVKCIWYLSDVTSDTGPFQYVADSHVQALKRRREYPLGTMRFDNVNDDLVEVEAKAGSLLVCDTRCIHRGKPIEHGSRYAVTLYTFVKANGAETLFRRSGIDPKHAGEPHSIA